MPLLRTGIAAATFAIIKLCHVLLAYSSKIDGVISDAKTAGTITEFQAAELRTFLGAANGACAIIRLISGY